MDASAPVDAAAHSRFVQRVRRRHAAWLTLLPPGLPSVQALAQAHATLQQQALDGDASLRVLRQLVLERLAQLDCDGQASLAEVIATMSQWAEYAVQHAYHATLAELVARHGTPHSEHGAAQLWVIGMGKLGARELNVSSDIDLICVYDHDGQTSGTAHGKGIGNHEFFSQFVKRLATRLGDITEYGQVFRVDLALRPNGNSGPVAVSLDALEEYFQVQGREWERFAWLKSRVVAPSPGQLHNSVQGLRNAVSSFVYRRYLDYNIFDALRHLHRQIRQHAQRRAAGHPERANDVKLSRGGIREIEFIVQLLQVVRGGQFPELRTRPTRSALQRVARANLMPQATATALDEAYAFLRQVEHRLQYLDDQQTHTLPTNDDDLAWLAGRMGFATFGLFQDALDTHRERVAEEFDSLLGGEPCGHCQGHAAPDLESVLPELGVELRTKLQPWLDSPRVRELKPSGQQRLALLLQRTNAWLDEGRIDTQAALRLTDWLEPLLRRENYLALLQERPAVHERLCHLLGAARWPARYLMRQPGVIDELADPNLLNQRFDGHAFAQELASRLHGLRTGEEDNEENLLNLLRRGYHAEVFRTLARDVEGCLSVEQVADDLSALTDTVLTVALQWCWQKFKRRHRAHPRLGIIAYGKLGGKELGYGSDLDIVFVFDDEDDSAADRYTALVRKLISWLTVKTGEGDLFEVDTALRPNGNSGLLVTRLEAYAEYQQQRGSNTAWTWEHQAITRARWVVGDGDMQQRFEAVRDAVLRAPRDPAKLAQEIVAMRRRVASSHSVGAGRFDLKHSPGGMVDVEFLVQYLVLAHGNTQPALRPNMGNIALLQRAEDAAMLPPGLGRAAADAYRTLRRLQHRARLDEASTQVAPEALAEARQAVVSAWAHCFGAARCAD
jgi:glutamate-ammonia-ligase adenylyltransferase